MAGLRSKLNLGWRYATGFAGLRSADVILASFPRAGSTWIRFLLCNYLSLQELDGQPIDFPTLDGTMPALGYSNLLTTWPYRSIPRIVKTHRPYNSILFALPSRVAYISRDPRDIAVSYYEFLKAHSEVHLEESFSQFIRHPRYGLQPCLEHHTSWSSRADIVVRYEKLLQDTGGRFRHLLAALSIPIHDEHAREAVARSTFAIVRQVESNSGLTRPGVMDEGFKFTRRGESGQWVEYFSKADLSYYDQLCVSFK
jgi:hypothetical protein